MKQRDWLIAMLLLVVLAGYLLLQQAPPPAQSQVHASAEASDLATPQILPGPMDAQPRPELLPEQVVHIILAALRDNDHPEPDAGIAITFRFASPANRLMTGPLERFISMVKAPQYQPMLGHDQAILSPIELSGTHARQTVVLTHGQGGRAAYIFILSKQSEGEFKDCWMTDAVVPINLEDPNPPRQRERRRPRVDRRPQA